MIMIVIMLVIMIVCVHVNQVVYTLYILGMFVSVHK